MLMKLTTGGRGKSLRLASVAYGLSPVRQDSQVPMFNTWTFKSTLLQRQTLVSIWRWGVNVHLRRNPHKSEYIICVCFAWLIIEHLEEEKGISFSSSFSPVFDGKQNVLLHLSV